MNEIMEPWSGFEELYRAYFPRVYAYLSLCLGAGEADDAAQQVFLKVWRGLSRAAFVPPQSWKAWIFRIAVNCKNDAFRVRARQPAAATLLDTDACVPGPEQAVLQSLAVEAAFRALPEEERDLLLLRGNGLNSREIGDILSLSDSTVRSRLAAAKARLRRDLKKNEVTVDDKP